MGSTLSRLLPIIFRPFALLAGAAVLAATLTVSARASEDPGLAAIGGEGVGSISGYVVSGIHYQLEETNPGLIRAVTFDVLGGDGQTRPTTVGVTLGPGQPTTACWSTDGDGWTCPVSFPAADASALRVAAAG